jgi:flagellar protein FlbD
MIRLTRLNDVPFYLNCDLIEFLEETPDTVITLSNGGKLLVKEPAETVVERIVAYRRRILEGPRDTPSVQSPDGQN